MLDPKKIAVHFSEQLYAVQVRLVIKPTENTAFCGNYLTIG